MQRRSRSEMFQYMCVPLHNLKVTVRSRIRLRIRLRIRVRG